MMFMLNVDEAGGTYFASWRVSSMVKSALFLPASPPARIGGRL